MYFKVILSLLIYFLLATFSYAVEGSFENSFPRRDIRQNHQIHTLEQDLECVECHQGAEKGVRAGMPEMDLCADCHEEESDDELKEKKGCLRCHTFAIPNLSCTMDSCTEEEMPDIEVTMGPEPYPTLRYEEGESAGGFSHNVHFKKKVTCQMCHGVISLEGRIPFPSGLYMPKANLCYNCHAKDKDGFSHGNHNIRDIECTECHEGVDLDDEPFFERGKYLPKVQVECRECHKPVSTACDTCHLESTVDQKIIPENHVSTLQ